MADAPESQDSEQQDQGQQSNDAPVQQQEESQSKAEQKSGPDNELWNDPVAAEQEILKLRKENETRRRRERAIDPKKIAAYDKWVEGQRTEQEKQEAQYKAQVERGDKLARRAARAEIMVLAAGEFADPSDAADTLDVAGYLNDDGEFDTESATEALKELLKRKPHWAKQQGDQRRGPRPDPSQGTSGNGKAPGLEEQIAQAQKDGDWKLVLRLQTQKMMPEIRQYASGQHR